jgi:hypothetical protein
MITVAAEDSRMKYFHLVMILSVLSLPVFGQFNDTTNYYINYASTGIVNKTNEGNSYILNNNIRFNIYKRSISLSTTHGWVYGKQRDNLTNNDFISVADVNLFKNERHLYYWALGNFEKSYSLKTNYRFQAGGGVGYYVIDRENFVIQISDGILYEKSDLYDIETSKLDYETVRNSFRVKFRFTAGGIFTIEGSDFLQHSLYDVKDYIIKSNTQVSLKLKKWLSFTVALNYNKLSVTSRENLLCNFGLALEKYF